jgi:hypothetical protein
VGVTAPDPLGVDLFLGPTFAYQVGCELELANQSGDCDDEAGNNFDPTKSFDVGFAVGAGISFAITPGATLLFKGLWDLGLMSIDDSAAENDVKNEAILLNVGRAFRPAR